MEPDAEAQVPKKSTEKGRGASGKQDEVPSERPLAFEVGHGIGFLPLPDDRFQGFQEVGTLREHLSI